jgi:hypothetical protein
MIAYRRLSQALLFRSGIAATASLDQYDELTLTRQT